MWALRTTTRVRRSESRRGVIAFCGGTSPSYSSGERDRECAVSNTAPLQAAVQVTTSQSTVCTKYCCRTTDSTHHRVSGSLTNICRWMLHGKRMVFAAFFFSFFRVLWYHKWIKISGGEVATFPHLSRKIGCSRPTIFRSRCLTPCRPEGSPFVLI